MQYPCNRFESILYFIKDNIDLFTDQLIFELYAHIREYQLEIDDSFHTIIVPISLEYIKCFNREQSLVFF